jgi:hypothetical protein
MSKNLNFNYKNSFRGLIKALFIFLATNYGVLLCLIFRMLTEYSLFYGIDYIFGGND